MNNCATSAGCTDAARIHGAPIEVRARPRRILTASQRREMLLLAHADFALLHARVDEDRPEFRAPGLLPARS